MRLVCDYRTVPQLHRFSSDIIVHSVIRCEDARSAPRRISSESRRGSRTCGFKALPADLYYGLAYARLRVQSVPARRAPPPPARGGMSVREYGVPVPVLHLGLSQASGLA